jgi:DNA-directed RNA polymerase beta' subunit
MKSASDQNKIKVKAIHSGDKYKAVAGNEYERSIYNYEILRLFESIPDSEMIKFGMPVESHPRHYYTRQLIVIPANMRFINNDNKNSYSNQHTACIEKIIKANNEIPGEIPAKKDTAAFGVFMNSVENLIRQYIEYIKVKANSDSNDAIYNKIKGKKGITRLSQLGKNVGKVFRVVITCDTSCPIDTIKIPKQFAQILTVDETVTEYNFDRLQMLFNNGPNYPGYNEITSIRNGKKYDSRNSTYKLQVGDVIHRHVLDGDTVPFHRFPTLTATCTTVMKILVHRDGNSSVAFNVLACDFFGADYDGDTMMGFLIGHEGIRFEAEYVMNMDNNYLEGKVTSGSNISILGQVLDSVAGFGLITRNFVKFTRYQVMDLIRDVQVNQKLTKEEYTGREVMSLVMPRIKYIAPSPFFGNKLITSKMSFRGKDEKPKEGDTRFDESDKEIRIIDGQILSGMVCGSAVKNSPGSIYHLIYDQYGSKKAHKIMYYHQQIIKRYLEFDCFSIGYKDLILEKKAYEMMDLTQSRIMAQLSELKNKLMNKNIVPPLGKDIATYVDEEILKIHNNSEGAYLWAILHGCKPEENAFFVSFLTGAKGKLANIYNMLAPLGQIKIDGKRIPSTLDFQRYDKWTPQFSLDAHVGGYVHQSYSKGVPFRSMYNNCKSARNNVLTKGLVVGEAGSAGRELIKAFESLLIDNRMFTIRNFGENIIEFAVADDGFEAGGLQTRQFGDRDLW